MMQIHQQAFRYALILNGGSSAAQAQDHLSGQQFKLMDFRQQTLTSMLMQNQLTLLTFEISLQDQTEATMQP
jgi:hypothetical protein